MLNGCIPFNNDYWYHKSIDHLFRIGGTDFDKELLDGLSLRHLIKVVGSISSNKMRQDAQQGLRISLNCLNHNL